MFEKGREIPRVPRADKTIAISTTPFSRVLAKPESPGGPANQRRAPGPAPLVAIIQHVIFLPSTIGRLTGGGHSGRFGLLDSHRLV